MISVFWFHFKPLYCDNKSVISIATNRAFHERTKHIEVDYHMTFLEYTDKKISLPYISFKERVADVFTKGSNYFSVLLLLVQTLGLCSTVSLDVNIETYV